MAFILGTDESSSGPFITGGAVSVREEDAQAALEAILEVKRKWRVAPDAKIHCRVLMAGSARLKSPFKHLSLEDCHSLLAECVDSVNAVGVKWWGGWVDQELYPRQLQLVDGEQFDVTDKHIKSLAVQAAIKTFEHHQNTTDYRLAYDPDPSLVSWGLKNRIQATHFSRTHPQAVELAIEEQRLLDLADVAAYALAQALLVSFEPPYLKPWHKKMAELTERMKLAASRMAYDVDRYQALTSKS